MKKNNWKKLIFGLTAIAIGVPTSAFASWPSFALYPISGIGKNPTQALAVNSFSEIAGLAQPGTNPLVFTGLFGGAGYTSQPDTLPNGYTSLEFSGINDSLYMIGTAMINLHPTAVGGQYNGNIVDMTAGIQYSYFSQVMGVNHQGMAVGYYNKEGNGVETHMFRWSSVSTTRTNDTLNRLPGGINENGTIVASNLKPTNYYQLAELDLIPTSGPTQTFLAPGNLLYIYPSGISTYGGITTIGEAYDYIENNSLTHIYGYAFNVAANQWQLLDAPNNPDYESHAVAVDVWGTRIAGYTVDPSGNQTAVVWELVNGNWVASYLSDLFPADSTWKYTQATGINTYGAISGFGMHLENEHWVQRGFVATPQAFFHFVFPEGGIFGGLTANPSIHVNGLNPFDVAFHLTTDSGVVSLPREVDMPGMENNASFSMQTMGVDRSTPVDITVRFGGLAYTQPVLLLPAVLQGMTLSSNVNSDGGRGSLMLHGSAGPSGINVSLTSSSSEVVVPASVTIPANASMANFRMVLGRRAKTGDVVTITATLGSRTVSQQVTIN